MRESALQMPHLTQTVEGVSYEAARWEAGDCGGVSGGRTGKQGEEHGEKREEDICGTHGC